MSKGNGDSPPHRNDLATRNKLAADNFPLVRGFVKKFAPSLRGHDLDDACSACWPAFLLAAERFDPSLGTAFSTLASYYVRFAIRGHLATPAGTIRVPRRKKKGETAGLLAKCRAASLSRSEAHLADPSTTARARRHARDDERERDERDQVAADVREALASLDPDDRAIIELKHFDGATLSEIGGVAGRPGGCTKERVRQRLDRAMGKLMLALIRRGHG